MIRRILAWIDEETEIISMIKAFMEEPLAKGVGWPHVFGSAALFLFMMQAITGVFLMIYYSPSPDHAYETVQYINRQVLFGRLVRGLHHWGASAMFLMVILHMLQTYFWGAYKKPRQIIWVLGVGLLLLTLGLSFTGYLLPWDQKAYWATVVGTNIAGTVPVIGGVIRDFIRGGEGVGALTLTRFFAVHVYFLPVLVAALAVFHLFQVRRKEITPPGKRAGEETDVEYTSLFYPHQAFKDAVVALFLLAVCLGLAWYYGAPTEAVANSADTAYVPRPEWYFLWLFELLKYFPGKWEFVGGVLLPLVGVIALLIYPYLDNNPERRPDRRPFATSVAILVLLGISALGVMAIVSTPKPRPLSAEEAKGQKVFLDLRCNACHGINGGGGTAGTDLAQAKLGERDPAQLERLLRKPTEFNPRSIMPALGPEVNGADIAALVPYLRTLDTNSRMPIEALVGPRKPASHLEENWFINHKFEVLKDPAYCSTCHKSSFCQSCHQNRRPDSHLHDWLKNHAGVAASRPEYCQVCHPAPQTLCVNCHDVMLHTPDWLTRHRSVPAEPRKLCSQCHPTDFCSNCHTGAKPQSHRDNWLPRHGKEAVKEGKEGCLLCHQQQFCADCHGVEMPHPADFLEQHPKATEASLAPGSPCFRCHKPAEFCGQCHEIPSVEKK